MSTLQNFVYDEISLGQTASYSKTLTAEDIALFAATSGDVNPVHLDPTYAADTQFGERIGHGMWTGAVISAALGMVLPGPGAIYLKQELTFREPVKIGDTVTVELEVVEKKDRQQFITIACNAVNQHGKRVANGSALVRAPSEKIRLNAPPVPPVRIDQ